jgi:hypothetical protein
MEKCGGPAHARSVCAAAVHAGGRLPNRLPLPATAPAAVESVQVLTGRLAVVAGGFLCTGEVRARLSGFGAANGDLGVWRTVVLISRW